MTDLARTEVKKTFSYTLPGLALTVADQLNIAELARLLTDEKALADFPSWEDRARYLGAPVARLMVWRRTPEYKQALKEALRIAALEASAASVGQVAAVAALNPKISGAEVVSAAKFLAATSGAGEDPPVPAVKVGQVIGTQVNMTLESKLLELAKKHMGPVVDVTPE